ncbi:MAG: polyprenol monophosphomannose synthase [Planctomycetes bacterium]|nr:polyprenol monophosphomannose synthase [Planctomycetota bacterium]
MTTADRILIALATYNERENLPPLVDEIRLRVPKAELLVVDDNSPDGTGQWIAERAKGDPRIHCIHQAQKTGLGAAIIAAYRFAVQHDYTMVITLDADGSHNPVSILPMLARTRVVPTGAPEVVIGSRYIAGGRTVGWPLYRRVMSRAVNILARIMLGLPTRDCSGALRCVRVSLLQRVDLDAVSNKGFGFLEEILWRFKKAGAKFAEVPIVFTNRTRGTSKMTPREALSALRILLRLGVRNWTGL